MWLQHEANLLNEEARERVISSTSRVALMTQFIYNMEPLEEIKGACGWSGRSVLALIQTVLLIKMCRLKAAISKMSKKDNC